MVLSEAYYSRQIEQRACKLRQWVLALSSAGFDLNEFAIRMVPALRSYLEVRTYCSGAVRGIQTEVSNGPLPRDWSIVHWEPVEPYANLFYRSTEDNPIYSDLAARLLRRMIPSRNQELLQYDTHAHGQIQAY